MTVSFTVGSKELAFGIVENISLIQYAESLGGIETLITYPLTQTHAEVSEELRKKMELQTAFFVLGIENVEDLILDLENAIHKAEAGILKSRQIIYRSHCDLV